MDVQSLPFILFTLNHFYLIQWDFLTAQRDVLLHTSFGAGGFLFQILSLKNSPKPTCPPPGPPKYFGVFFFILAETCLQRLRFLQFFEQIADCIGGFFELSNNFYASIHCWVKVTGLSVLCILSEEFKTEFCYMSRTNKSSDRHCFCQSLT
jgi:hypothetical protein